MSNVKIGTVGTEHDILLTSR